MTYLLDTNVVSELYKTPPFASVSSFVNSAEDQSFISVITLAELRFGVATLAQGRRRDALERWLDADLQDRFEGRVLDIDSATARAWGDLMALSQRVGANVHAMDGMIAATALAHDLTLVTRNIRDFVKLDVRLLNPWDDA